MQKNVCKGKMDQNENYSQITAFSLGFFLPNDMLLSYLFIFYLCIPVSIAAKYILVDQDLRMQRKVFRLILFTMIVSAKRNEKAINFFRKKHSSLLDDEQAKYGALIELALVL